MRYRMLLTLILVLGCTGSPTPLDPGPGTPPPPPSGSIAILMLGNSLTYTHDVPGLIADLAAAAGQPRPTVRSISHPDWSLQEHAGNPTSTAAIASGEYQVVVMQQGPSTLAASRDHLINWSGLLGQEIVSAGARGALYAVWPPLGGNIEAGIRNYADAARINSLELYPVALAFEEARKLDPMIQLLRPDNFHQAPAGALLAAMVITAGIFDTDPVEFSNPRGAQVNETDFETLRAAASTTWSAATVK